MLWKHFESFWPTTNESAENNFFLKLTMMQIIIYEVLLSVAH